MTTAPIVHPAISKSRLEFLFDGVFAIAMTILVLELHVPDLVDRHSVSELGHALAQNRYTFLSYLLSFAVLGMFWYRHNHQYHHFRVITRTMLVLHIVQLAAAAFFPFCAALFGRYSFNPLAGVVYVGCILVYSYASVATWLVAVHSGSTEEPMGEGRYQRRRNRMLRSCVLLTILFVFYLGRAL